MTQKNFLCSIEAYDLVEQFVNSFFTVYDSPQRSKLTGNLKIKFFLNQ